MSRNKEIYFDLKDCKKKSRKIMNISKLTVKSTNQVVNKIKDLDKKIRATTGINNYLEQYSANYAGQTLMEGNVIENKIKIISLPNLCKILRTYHTFSRDIQLPYVSYLNDYYNSNKSMISKCLKRYKLLIYPVISSRLIFNIIFHCNQDKTTILKSIPAYTPFMSSRNIYFLFCGGYCIKLLTPKVFNKLLLSMFSYNNNEYIIAIIELFLLSKKQLPWSKIQHKYTISINNKKYHELIAPYNTNWINTFNSLDLRNIKELNELKHDGYNYNILPATRNWNLKKLINDYFLEAKKCFKSNSSEP